jgi:hypothetical protein
MRVHFLLHAHATTDFDKKQPGYGYGPQQLKSRPITELPLVAELAVTMEAVSRKLFKSTSDNSDNQTYWNIGVNPLYYQDGRYYMGKHADNNQGENVILTTVVESSYPRRIVIRHNIQPVQYELFLKAGDAYCMDGAMQLYDGLYFATFHGNDKNGVKIYRLRLARKGEGLFENRIAIDDYVKHCIRLRTMLDAAVEMD